MISRRNFCAATGSLASGSLLSAEDAERPMVVLNFTVSDRAGRLIRDLRPSDIRVLEDGISLHCK
jgi:hypothetical protein